MHTTFNSASLAKLSKSQLYALLAEHRAKLDAADESERSIIKAAISTINRAIAFAPDGPG